MNVDVNIYAKDQIRLRFAFIITKLDSHIFQLVYTFLVYQTCKEIIMWQDFAVSCLLIVFSDSSDNVCIEDCIIAMGHDAISLKSGWDEYGIAYGRPTTDVHIRRVLLQSSSGSSVAFGSEMSGGISNVQVEKIHLYDSLNGIEFRTTKGRGGYIKQIVISDAELYNINVAFGACGNCGSHPDDDFDPDALPAIDQITFKDIIGTNITIAGNFTGIQEAPFANICLSNISLLINPGSYNSWECSNIHGSSESVFPEPCPELENSSSNSSSTCFSLIRYYGRASFL